MFPIYSPYYSPYISYIFPVYSLTNREFLPETGSRQTAPTTTLSRVPKLSPKKRGEPPQNGRIPRLFTRWFGGRDAFTRVNRPPQPVRLSWLGSPTKSSITVCREDCDAVAPLATDDGR